ncbi:hypothetical protein [Mucilaginibacter polytrichastri]|uniref:Lipocalin-like domain-containing protein n=1 Tax=Mucilaginibacter polytrichastri TaxID=1302689 RepID=A0A1Q6A178_9SPHI|nr:hypothetical protein [Mucilaginibacter polytrichastri]OKS87763.1 hypothetical protein RG47T_3225 [Mucilaginibacter polytrichastri]SFT26677.1 hypothetical protein SAMN04487890_1262 [Mucilaginibacter polytrichastri]
MTISANRFPAIIPSALTLLVVLLFSACSYINNKPERKIVNKLAGTWKLDSVLENDGKYHRVDTNGIDVVVFDKEMNFVRNHWSGDVGHDDSGKYTVAITPQREIASVSLIPNLKIKGKDTTRHYYNFDVVKITDSLLYKIDATELREQDDGKPAIVFNKHSVYKRIGKK